MKELRDIKLDLLMGNQNPIIDLFNEITSGIKIINTNVYNEEGLEFIYHKDGQWIFYQDCQNGEFWCNYKRYWSLFESNLKLEYVEIQAITKYLVEEALKREVDTPDGMLLFKVSIKVEEALKREVDTPSCTTLVDLLPVEEALKREVDTPALVTSGTATLVEEALKREVGTPRLEAVFSSSLVEEALKREIGTPHEEYFLLKIKVEEALKREVGTPHSYIYNYSDEVEEALKRNLENKM